MTKRLAGVMVAVLMMGTAACSAVSKPPAWDEAERTVSVAAARTTMSIEAAGGHLLGLVLNKRRYIIPDWIYGRWLAAGGREGV